MAAPPLRTPAVDGRVERLRVRLRAWHEPAARRLPWRGVGDPWAVLVSEVMLQQTRAERVVPAWAAFLHRFPRPAALAAAAPADAVAAWAGLGYNRRAVNLHRTATVVVERHDGAVPDDLAALRALPGVGEYTARAVRAFAFGEAEAPVDTNVARVLARAFAGIPLGRRAAQDLGDALVPPAGPAAWTEALMDLGAGVCRARTPACGRCPLAVDCAWRRDGGPDPAAVGAHRPRPQTPFAGSDRACRGRLVGALRVGPVPSGALARVAGTDDAVRLRRLVDGLVADGLAEWAGDRLRLPHGLGQRRGGPPDSREGKAG